MKPDNSLHRRLIFTLLSGTTTGPDSRVSERNANAAAEFLEYLSHPQESTDLPWFVQSLSRLGDTMDTMRFTRALLLAWPNEYEKICAAAIDMVGRLPQKQRGTFLLGFIMGTMFALTELSEIGNFFVTMRKIMSEQLALVFLELAKLQEGGGQPDQVVVGNFRNAIPIFLKHLGRWDFIMELNKGKAEIGNMRISDWADFLLREILCKAVMGDDPFRMVDVITVGFEKVKNPRTNNG